MHIVIIIIKENEAMNLSWNKWEWDMERVEERKGKRKKMM